MKYCRQRGFPVFRPARRINLNFDADAHDSRARLPVFRGGLPLLTGHGARAFGVVRPQIRGVVHRLRIRPIADRFATGLADPASPAHRASVVFSARPREMKGGLGQER